MTEPATHIRYRALTWLSLAAALAYLCRNAIGVAESSVREDLGLTLEQSGWFLGAFFWSYAVFQVPCGWFAQKYGTRLALAVFAIVWSLATLGIGLAPGFWMLIVVMLAMGISQAGIVPAVCESIGHWFPVSQRSLACGVMTAGMQVGAIAASGLTGLLLQSMNWRTVFLLFSVPGMIWAIGFLGRFRNRPEQDVRVNQAERQLIDSRPDEAESQSIKAEHDDEAATVAKVGDVVAAANSAGPSAVVIWLLCGQQICRAAGYMFFASWFPTFLQATRGVSIGESGLLQGMVLAGSLIGCLIGGSMTDWILRRTGSLRLSRSGMGSVALMACGCLILGAWFVDDSRLAIALLVLGTMSASLAGPPTFAAIIDIGGDRVPQLTGLVNMCGNFAAAACPVIVGKLFERTENWNLVLILFAVIYLTGGLCWALVNPESSKPKPNHSRTIEGS